MIKSEQKSGSKQASRRQPAAAKAAAAQRNDGFALEAFLCSLEPVLVDPPIYHEFSGSIDRSIATAIWVWMARDIAQSEAARLGDAVDSGAEPEPAFDLLLPEILEKLKQNAEAEEKNPDFARRNTVQMGGEDARRRLPHVIMAMRRRTLLEQATNFGCAMGSLSDEITLASVLQTINLKNPVTRALWMHAMVGYMSNPGRVMAAAVRIAGGGDEVRISNAGFAPLVEAMLAHAQTQIGKLATMPGVFSDIDLACKAVDRFHRLMRAINHNLDIEHRSLWGKIIGDLTGHISERLDRPMREIGLNVTQALRRPPRENQDRVDADRVLAALNGLYLLSTVRRSRDSLAVNALLDQAWSETGKVVETHVTRALEMYRAEPGDTVLRERLDAGIQMAEIRFNPEYAEILRKARDGAGRRLAQG